MLLDSLQIDEADGKKYDGDNQQGQLIIPDPSSAGLKPTINQSLCSILTSGKLTGERYSHNITDTDICLNTVLPPSLSPPAFLHAPIYHDTSVVLVELE